jgi:hypothetical protein
VNMGLEEKRWGIQGRRIRGLGLGGRRGMQMEDSCGAPGGSRAIRGGVASVLRRWLREPGNFRESLLNGEI